MDITEFAIGLRDSALLVGDYKSYREQLSRKLLATRRRLGRTTGKNAKFQRKPSVTAENVKEKHEYEVSRSASRVETDHKSDMHTSSSLPQNGHGRMPCTSSRPTQKSPQASQ